MSIYLEIHQLTHVRLVNILSVIYVFGWYLPVNSDQLEHPLVCSSYRVKGGGRGGGVVKSLYICIISGPSGQCLHVPQTGCYVL